MKKGKRSERIANRNRAIHERYEVLQNKNYKGIAIYRGEVIINMIADEFYLSAKTVEDILYNRRKEEKTENLNKH